MKEFLSEQNVKYAYVDILSSVGTLKSYLKIRDVSDSHEQARQNHAAGIPTLVIDDKVFIVGGVEHARQLVEEYHLAEQE